MNKMKSGLSCFGQASLERSPKVVSKDQDYHSNVGFAATIANFMKSSCLCAEKDENYLPKKQNNHSYSHKHQEMSKERTLGEWLLLPVAIPISSNTNTSNGEEKSAPKQHSNNKVHPSTNGGNTDLISYANPRKSFSKQKLLEHEEMAHSENWEVSSVSGCQSGKVKKRVHFKVPEKEEFIIYNSPEVEEPSDLTEELLAMM